MTKGKGKIMEAWDVMDVMGSSVITLKA